MSNVTYLWPHSWSITMANISIPGTQCWFLLLLANCEHKDSLGEWKSIWPGPCITKILAIIITLWVQQAMTKVSSERVWLLCTKWIILSISFKKFPLGEVILLWIFTRDKNIFIFSPFRKVILILLHKFSYRQFPNYVSSKSLAIHPNYWP